ncbi:TetR/AcrR family transcriptional regulator [Clostridium sp. KNHs216]|uniref:TetR/AcrR family transcriptional regulator n=1 Tax=Clostridium sp. KNHs216 TaxID=1550235 RepID=UPI001151E9BF|nr:TetR/AcrR family transcriptional regulator [Clostridium sp. KNHs216]TQI67079.1 TetR family transcriptional regulator [Clostridium sp. KNHs216]
MKPIFDDPLKMKKYIIESAISVFAEKGYASTNMQDIADLAGISRGPLYYYFNNKAELYLAALKETIRLQIERYHEIFGREAFIIDKIREDLQYCMTALKSGKKDIIIVWQKEMPVEAKALIDNYIQTLYEIKIDSVRKAIAGGEMNQNTNPKIIVDLMFMLYEGIRVVIFDLGIKVEADEIDELIESSISQIKNKYCTE